MNVKTHARFWERCFNNCQGVKIPKRHGLLSDIFTANSLIQRSYIKDFMSFKIASLSSSFSYLSFMLSLSVHLKHDCNIISFLQGSMVNLSRSVNSLTGSFLTYPSGIKAQQVSTHLKKAETHLFFKTIPPL